MSLSHRTLWKDIWRCLIKSKGRFFSIMILLAIGSFALVGLKVASPDMSLTAQHYFNAHHLADVQVMSTMGLDKTDCSLLRKIHGVERSECGYLTDVTLGTSNKAIRLFSNSSKISTYEVVSGRLPRSNASSEIALSNQLSGTYKISQTVEAHEDSQQSVLRTKKLKIVGFVHSVELISTINLGQSRVGTGSLEGYGVLSPTAFRTDYYTLARLTFRDMRQINPYSNAYTERLRKHKKQIEKALAGRPEQRLAEIKKTATDKLDAAQQEIDSNTASLTEKQERLSRAQEQFNARKIEAQQGEQRSADGLAQLNTAREKLDATHAQLEQLRGNLEYAREQIIAAQHQLDALQNAPPSADNTQTQQLHAQLSAQLNQQSAAYNAALAQYEAGAAEYEKGLQTYTYQLAQWEQANSQLRAGAEQLKANESTLNSSQAQLDGARTQLDEARRFLDTSRSDTFKQLNELEEPVYSVYGRNDWPGHEGYTVYSSSPRTIDALSHIFAVFLFFVAVMVTVATMSRFVDEERTNAGSMKALGYSDTAIMLKFVVYGALASLIGSLLGSALGHVVLPTVIYAAHSDRFTLPALELHFDGITSMISVATALACATAPAIFVCLRELREKPSVLLLPKPPAAGSKIILEHIPVLWNRLSFTYKVTLRNIMRYKDRMFMTLFGVASATALLFAGLGLQYSINSINNRQFNDLVHYDVIVSSSPSAQTSAEQKARKEQKAQLEQELRSSAVRSSTAVHFETVSKVAGPDDEAHSIALIASNKPRELSKFMTLLDAYSHRPLELTDKGAIISHRLAKLTGVHAGDTLSFKDADGRSRSVRITGISEMYMGHYMYMTATTYKRVFSADYEAQGYLVQLKNRSISSVEKEAARLTELDAVSGVVQNVALSAQMDTIAQSLNKVMFVLVLVSMLLTFCILYNLTNINVSERIRELSTVKVLGFFNGEVTLYIYRETIILSLLGTLMGFGLGRALHAYMLEVVPPSSTMFYAGTGLWAYIVPAVAIAVALGMLAAYVHHRLRSVDMLEALKAVD